MWNLGLISGQMTGGWLFTWSPDWPLYAAAALCFANLALLTVVGPSPRPARRSSVETPEPVTPHQSLSAAFARLAWISNLGGAFAMSMVFHLLPRLLVELDVAPDKHGSVLAVSRVVVIGTYFVLYRLSFWHMRLGPAFVSQCVAAGGLVLISQAEGAGGILLGLVCLAQLVGFNYFASLFYSTAGSSHERRGAASGLHEATLAMGFAAGSGLGGLAGKFGDGGTPYRLAAAVVLSLALVQAIVYLTQVRPLQSDPTSA